MSIETKMIDLNSQLKRLGNSKSDALIKRAIESELKDLAKQLKNSRKKK